MIAKTETDTEGLLSDLSVYPASGHYDLQATHGDKGKWEMGVQLSAGDRAKMNLTLRKAISISGNLLALDNNTPNAGVACGSNFDRGGWCQSKKSNDSLR